MSPPSAKDLQRSTSPVVSMKIVVVDLALIFDTEMSCGGKEADLIQLAAETKQGDLFN